MTPGMGLKKGTAAGEVVLATSGLACDGVVLENMTEGAATLRTAFAAGERVRYGREPGFRFMAFVKSGQDLTKGAFIAPDSTGKWVAGTDASDSCARLIQEGGTGGALGADGYFLAKWGVTA